MKKFFFSLGVVFLLSSLAFSKSDSCTECHQQKGSSQLMEHNYADWEKSIHAAVGVQCFECHGGNPTAKDPVKAHQGVLSSRQKDSSVYFQKVPATCGRCHMEEFKEFQKSIHYKTLLRTGKGPNCLTCHGTMATTVMTYADMERTCSLCHGKPMQAAKALSLIHSVQNLLEVYQKQTSQEKFSESPFTQQYEQLKKQWHSFDVVQTIKNSENLIQAIKKELEGSKKKKE